MDTNKREYYRIEYPLGDAPEFLLKNAKYPVLDISEHGLRYAHSGPDQPALGATVSGIIVLTSDRLKIEGRVVRRMGQQVALYLSKPIALSLIMEEQRRLLQKYKTLKMS